MMQRMMKDQFADMMKNYEDSNRQVMEELSKVKSERDELQQQQQHHQSRVTAADTHTKAEVRDDVQHEVSTPLAKSNISNNNIINSDSLPRSKSSSKMKMMSASGRSSRGSGFSMKKKWQTKQKRQKNRRPQLFLKQQLYIFRPVIC